MSYARMLENLERENAIQISEPTVRFSVDEGKTFTTLEHAQMLRVALAPTITPRPLMLGRAKAKR